MSSTAAGGPLNTTYAFSAAGSGDPDNNTPLAYLWDFGDGVTRETSTPSTTYQYATAGARTVSLRVRDSGSPQQTSDPASLQVFPGNAAPTADIELTNLSDQARGQYRLNDTWRYRAVNVSDDQPLPPDALSWTVVFHHQDHTHPFITTATGSEGQIVPNYTEWDPIQWYRVILRVRDAAGQETTVYADLQPELGDLRFESLPTGSRVIVDGISLTTPATIRRVVGNSSLVDFPSPQSLTGQTYAFSAWSQGGARTQTLTIAPNQAAYTVTLSALDRLIFLPSLGR